jgi:hypothetical protein
MAFLLGFGLNVVNSVSIGVGEVAEELRMAEVSDVTGVGWCVAVIGGDGDAWNLLVASNE